MKMAVSISFRSGLIGSEFHQVQDLGLDINSGGAISVRVSPLRTKLKYGPFPLHSAFSGPFLWRFCRYRNLLNPADKFELKNPPG